ncbi:hypothetical protein Pmani_009048 [Petrolisthes manimaculis]|uniref:Uncharacterized protein n=1 Tax=Petrolisthes manimaculis TaxID=1843537 RepID=A0AAE1UIU5_9EUCA|nr:hypothetical protein Pmani_009048 [Petrolisthes manimaculis]
MITPDLTPGHGTYLARTINMASSNTTGYYTTTVATTPQQHETVNRRTSEMENSSPSKSDTVNNQTIVTNYSSNPETDNRQTSEPTNSSPTEKVGKRLPTNVTDPHGRVNKGLVRNRKKQMFWQDKQRGPIHQVS